MGTFSTTPQQILGARAMLRWSQDELAARAGISKPALVKLEAGKVANPRPETMEKLENALQNGGIEFTADGGVRPQQGKIQIFEGPTAYLKMLDDAYHTLNKNSGEFLHAFIDNRLSPPEVIKAEARIRSLNCPMRFLVEENNYHLNHPLYEYRSIPSQFYINAPQAIYGNKYAILSDNQVARTIVIIEDENIAEAQRNYFNFLWQHAKAPSHTEANKKYA